MKKLLICYASIGSGHQSAAEAIENAVSDLFPEIHIQMSDTLDETLLIGPAISEILSFIATTVFPKAYDKAWHTGSLSKIYKNVEQLNLLQLNIHKLIEEYQPDVVVCTHALPASILAALKNRKSYSGNVFPIVAVATDFQVHPYWPVEGIQAFVVSSSNAKDALIERGLPEENIFAFGIPIHPEFSLRFNNFTPAGRETGSSNNPADNTVLFLAGSRSVAPYLTSWPLMIKVLRILARDKKSNLRIQVVLGKSKIMRELIDVTEHGAENIEIYGFVDNMPDFLYNADIVVTKPGGMIIAETLAIGRPIVMLTKGMGQEAANAEILHASGVGYFSDNPQEVVDFIQGALNNEETLNSLKSKAKKMGFPEAAFNTANLIQSLASQ